MMQHQSPEYDSVPAESIQVVSRFKWRMVLMGLVLTLAGGIILTLVLANGAANPPRATYLIDIPSIEYFPVEYEYENLRLLRFRVLAGTWPYPPLTVEATATNTGDSDSAWGFWIEEWRFMVNNQGYVSCINRDEPLWVEFIHAVPYQETVLYLDVDRYGKSTFRINGEIACENDLDTHFYYWGIVQYREPHLR